MIIKSGNDQKDLQISKRDLLKSIGMVGGSAAVFTAMQGWDLAEASTSKAPPTLSSDGKGKKLVILGAGLSGMIIAHEMTKKGYQCQILEADMKVGGRCQSARKGHVIKEEGMDDQVCNFTDGQYFNYGPWRIPAQHLPTLHYCHKLGVKLEPLINKSPQAYYYAENIEGPLKGVSVRQGDVDYDRAGHVEELLAKAIDQGRLDDMVSVEDKEKLLEHLRDTGLINRKSLDYGPSRVRGYSDYPGAGEDFGKLSDPYGLSDLFKMPVGRHHDTEDHPVVMFQPVGGMDMIAKALHASLPSDMVTLNAEVIEMNHHEDGVEVTYKDANSGKNVIVRGDYCISTIQFPVLSKIKNNLNKELLNAIKAPAGTPAFKQGLQMKQRFWEQEEMIYGGASFSDIPGHNVTAYPSSDLHSNLPGVVLGSYIWGGEAARLSNLSIEDRVAFALSVGEKIHPGKYKKNFNGHAMTMAWHRQKYHLGGWVTWTARKRRRQLPTVLKGEKRMLFSGNNISTVHSGWMVGAIEAAWYTMAELDKRVGQG
ncbi:MAG: flavin monoamine oxidase family protein [Emcibacteraceae bacterium]|nr:flavin monoamine oxidase family protein [Emcibacteraceae bacterium]